MTARRAFSLVVFDWDGTLLDSIGAIVGCTVATLESLGQRPLAEGEIRRLIGLGLRESVEALCPGCDDELFAAVVARYREHWLATFQHRISLFPGVAKLLDRLGQEGYLLALATAKGRTGLARDLERTGMTGRFHAIRTVDDSPSKPHPGMLLEILEELGVRPDRAVMVGDTIHDLQMAGSAGMAAVAVSTGSASRESLESLEPEACLEAVAELPAWLERRRAADAASAW